MLTGNPGPATALPLETRPLPLVLLPRKLDQSKDRIQSKDRSPHPRRAEGGGGGDQCPALDTTWAPSQLVRNSQSLTSQADTWAH